MITNFPLGCRNETLTTTTSGKSKPRQETDSKNGQIQESISVSPSSHAANTAKSTVHHHPAATCSKNSAASNKSEELEIVHSHTDTANVTTPTYSYSPFHSKNQNELLYLYTGTNDTAAGDGCAPIPPPHLRGIVTGHQREAVNASPWTQLHVKGPEGRIGHTLCTNAAEDRVYIYGGVNDTPHNISFYLGDLHEYDYYKKTWTEIQMKGPPQCAKAFHTAVWHDSLMYIFGGCNGRGRFNKLFSVDKDGTVVVIEVGSNNLVPCTRYCHSATVFEDRMYIYAGKCGGRNSNRRLEDLWLFDFTSQLWQECPQYGSKPTPRSAHAAFTYGRSMIMFGGRNKEGECCEDLHHYSYDSNIWRKIETRQNYFGRARHSVVVHNSRVVVFGGWNGRKKLNDLFYYDMDNEMFETVQSVEDSSPSRRECHVAVMCKNTMIVFGGRFRSTFMYDTCELQLGPKTLKENCREWLVMTLIPLLKKERKAKLRTEGESESQIADKEEEIHNDLLSDMVSENSFPIRLHHFITSWTALQVKPLSQRSSAQDQTHVPIQGSSHAADSVLGAGVTARSPMRSNTDSTHTVMSAGSGFQVPYRPRRVNSAQLMFSGGGTQQLHHHPSITGGFLQQSINQQVSSHIQPPHIIGHPSASHTVVVRRENRRSNSVLSGESQLGDSSMTEQVEQQGDSQRSQTYT